MTKIVQVICPGCKNPIHTRVTDSLLLCDCGTLHVRDGVPTILEYQTGVFTRPGDGEKAYMPFWKVLVNFNIRHTDVVGGSFSRFVNSIAGRDGGSAIVMMLPAFELEPWQYKDLAKQLTMNTPVFTAGRMDPSISREPSVITLEMVDEMADFLFVTIEAEKPGVMQRLDYDLQVASKSIVYLPYYKKDGHLEPGF
jgi:hypothetical protein